MKKEHYIIASYLMVVGVFVFAFLYRYTDSRVVLSRVFQNYQNMSDKYVAETILSADGSDQTEDSYTFNNVVSPMPLESTMKSSPFKNSPVLGFTTEPKKIVVDLSKQRVYAYEGNQLVLNFLVSTGKFGATPPGNYKIWYKVRAQTMKGGSRELGTYYYLPNVQFVQYFNKAIGFHSTYWHNNFGTPMSHGCVNMTLTDAETLYHWASPTMAQGVRIFRSNTDNPGTPVEVVQSWKI